MRMLDQAAVIAEPRQGGGARLRFKIPTGEEIGVDLSPERTAELSEQLATDKFHAPKVVEAPAAKAAAPVTKAPKKR